MKVALFFFVAIFALTTAQDPSAGGTWGPINIEDDHVTALAAFGAKHISNASNSPYHKRLVGVVGAKMQVVAGYNYEISFEMATTNCQKRSTGPITILCDILEDIVSIKSNIDFKI